MAKILATKFGFVPDWWNADVSSDAQLEQKNIFSDWRWKTKFKKYFNFWLYACVFLSAGSYLWKFTCFYSHCCRCMWCLAFWVLWCLACCSQNIVAKAQQPIATSHCLHMHLSGKRQRCIYRSPLNLVYVITNMPVYLHTRGDTNWETTLIEIQRLATYLSKCWWRQRQAWALPPFVWPTNHNGASYFLLTTGTWPCIFRVSAVDSKRETCSV